jgi:PAS domain S-box-containing protein
MKKGTEKDSEGQSNFPEEGNEYINHILNSSRAMMSVINRKYQYVKVNSKFCNAHQKEADELIGKTLGEVWGEDVFNTKIRGNIDRCFDGVTIRYEASFDTPQTEKRFFEVTFSPLAEEGPVKYLLAETLDVTNIRQTEKTAMKAEEEFRRFETNLPIGFIRCATDGTILHINKAFMIIMDCPGNHSLTSVNLGDFYSERELFGLHLGQLLSDFKPKAFGRVSLKNCKGSDIVCRISGFMNIDETGKPSHIDFAFEDSTHELMLENRLLQAQKLETIGALAGGIAHDFNNIMATISGYTELLLSDLPENSESAEHVSRIRSAVEKAQSLTSQILTFSMQMEQEKVHVNVIDVLNETVGFVRAAAPSFAKIECDSSGPKKYVFADPTQLFRVFLNLMTNAIQSLENREGTVKVSLAVEDGSLIGKKINKTVVADEYVHIKVADTGKGMDSSLMQRIFEPFFTTREVGQGSGLGLSVVHGIVSEMNGEIFVTSKLGSGSTFSVYLPATLEYSDQENSGAVKRKILLVKGNKFESRVLSIALESAGFEVLQAEIPSDLNVQLSDDGRKPEIVLYMSDSEKIKLSDLEEALRRMNISLPCILITDNSGEKSHGARSESGIITQRLIKPVSLKEIEAAIQLSNK